MWKLHLNNGTANGPIDVILFLAFTLSLLIIPNLLVYSFLILSFICWCHIHALSLIHKYLLCQVLYFVSELIFLLSVVFAHVSIPTSIWISLLRVLTVYWSSSSVWLISLKSSCVVCAIFLSLLLVLHILCKTCWTFLCEGLDTVKIPVLIMSPPEISYLVLLYLLCLLASVLQIYSLLFQWLVVFLVKGMLLI